MDDPMTRLLTKLQTRLGKPVDAASLAFFRIAFGAILFVEMVAILGSGLVADSWIRVSWIDPVIHFTYFGFGWVGPWPGFGMYVHVAVLAVSALGIALGYRYRWSAALFFLGFTYLFLLEQANYLNHFYLVCLISLLLILVPTHAASSLDARRKPSRLSGTVPTWSLWLLRTQIGIVYVYAAVAKMGADWLRGEPMRIWLSRRTDVPVIGRVAETDWAPYLFSYGGLLLDLLVVPFLLWRKTRPFAFAAAVAFHLMNNMMFNIGIFPWFMLAATTLFFEPDWPRRLLRWWRAKRRLSEQPTQQQPVTATAAPAGASPTRYALAGFVGVYLAVQLLFPLRHHLYPGPVNWTEEGHRFSWHMMLRAKPGAARFEITDPTRDTTWTVDPRDYISRRWAGKMPARPDMVLQFAHFLGEEARKVGVTNAEVRARVRVSLNGRQAQWLVDPRVDLTRVRRTLRSADWIVPLQHPLKTEPRDHQQLTRSQTDNR